MELALFLVVAVVAVVAGMGVIVARNPVYSALFMVLNLFCVAVLYLTLGAEFLAAIQVIIYAGAIMVLFLFVVTLLNPEVPEAIDRRRNQRLFAGALGVVLLVEALLVFGVGALPQVAGAFPPAKDVGNTQAIGALLFTDFLFPFEVTSILLLVGMVGAIVLAQRRP